MKNEVYISVDIESDGPIPGTYSMLSFGAAAAVVRNGDGSYTDLDLDSPTNQFYAEMKPISDAFVPEALAVSGLNRDLLKTQGEDPRAAMTRFAAWAIRVGEDHDARVIFAAYPLGFDWMFLYWYLVSFSESGSPFGHSSHIDMKTLYAARAGEPIHRSVKSRMPSRLKSNRKHTHNGLDDAIEQGEMLRNLLRWDGARQG